MSENTSAKQLPKKWYALIIVVLLVALIGVGAWAISESMEAQRLRSNYQKGHDSADVETMLEEHGIALLDSSQASNNTNTAEELAYLLEEEKLAHDVYQAMYEKWGSRVFANIQVSEAMHQDMVWALMESRELDDPRSDTFGTFQNAELQTLYDELIERGNESVTEAYKVGVAIEQKDIADLNKTLDRLDPQDTDVRDVIENLIHSSENHLRAFNRQISR